MQKKNPKHANQSNKNYAFVIMPCQNSKCFNILCTNNFNYRNLSLTIKLWSSKHEIKIIAMRIP